MDLTIYDEKGKASTVNVSFWSIFKAYVAAYFALLGMIIGAVMIIYVFIWGFGLS